MSIRTEFLVMNLLMVNGILMHAGWTY